MKPSRHSPRRRTFASCVARMRAIPGGSPKPSAAACSTKTPIEWTLPAMILLIGRGLPGSQRPISRIIAGSVHSIGVLVEHAAADGFGLPPGIARIRATQDANVLLRGECLDGFIVKIRRDDHLGK